MEVHHGVDQGLVHCLGDHFGQGQVVNLLRSGQVKLGTGCATELPLVLVNLNL